MNDMKKIFVLALAALVTLSAGCRRTISVDSSDMGTFALNLEYDKSDYIDIPTKSDVDVSTFSILLKKSDGTPVQKWDSYTQMPSTVTLAPGEYSIEAMTPDSEPAAFEQPVYRGETSFTIESGKMTTVEVVCALDNVKVTVNLGQSFVDEVKDYSITVRAMDYNKSLVFTQDEVNGARAGYFYVSPLEIHIIGKRALDGSEVNDIQVINDVNKRDHLILNLNARATGDVGSLTITIDYDTNDRDEDIEVPGFPDDPVVDPEPEPDKDLPKIEFSCEEEVTFTDEQAASAVVDITIKAVNGIENLFVEIQAPTLLELLAGLGLGGAVASGNWDIANIEDPALAEFLGGLGLYNAQDPIKGKDEHMFPIGSFMALMPAQDDPYPFQIKVIDSKGKQSTRTLTVYRVK